MAWRKWRSVEANLILYNLNRKKENCSGERNCAAARRLAQRSAKKAQLRISGAKAQ
jgi:hypothetical protein